MKCGAAFFLALLLLFITESTSYESTQDAVIADEEIRAREWIKYADTFLSDLHRIKQIGVWNFETNMTEETERQRDEGYEKFEVGLKQLATEQKQFLHSNAYKDNNLQLQLNFYSESGISLLSPSKLLEFQNLVSKMEYFTTTFEMVQTDDPILMADKWKEYYDKSSTPKRIYYKRYLELKREAAALSGMESPWHEWLLEYGGPPFEQQLDTIIEQIRPLYDQLHAYIRHQLRIKYGDSVVSAKGPIPLHVFNRNKESLLPYPDKNDKYQIRRGMQRKNYTPRSLYERADEFFQSLNFSKVPDLFWENSIFEHPRDGRRIVCVPPSSWTFEVKDDVRIKHCSKITEDDLDTAHHEMGHIQYMLQYQHLPFVFRAGANSGFHEAVGETIYLSASTPKHMARIGLLEVDGSDEEKQINTLMYRALGGIVGILSRYATEQYRKELFLKSTTVEDNCRFWQLKDKYVGVEPPVERSDDDFDVASSKTVSSDLDLLSYIVAFIAQFQFHKGLCEKAGEYVAGDPVKTLNTCDIYGSVTAGEALKKMLSLGASKPWPDAMEEVTGQRQLDAGPVLEYFRPLHEWLERTNRKNEAAVGWTTSKKCHGRQANQGSGLSATRVLIGWAFLISFYQCF